ncbi:MAG: phosphatase [Massiliimalia sp.]|jgi:putative hydrolase
MLKIIADTHTHTIASDHAYSTILENARYAADMGLSCIAMTDHAVKGGDAPHIWYFDNLDSVPDYLFGVRILKGAEVNLLDYQGNIDLEKKELKRLEWIIASIHSSAMPRGTVEQITNAYLGVAKNPAVDVIGHCGSTSHPFNYEKGIKAFKEYGKLVEINQNTFKNRKSSIPNCVEIARLCKKYEVPVVVNSDAHFAYSIGHVDDALKLLEEVGYPEKWIINADQERFDCFVQELKKHKQKIFE